VVEAPVVTQEALGVRDVDLVLARAEVVARGQADHVDHVLAGEIDDLQRLQQQVDQRQRVGTDGESVAKLERVAHLQPIDEQVDFDGTSPGF
jgi:hypothetical protein